MNAILVARVSTEEQKEAGNSLPAQIVRLEKYCQNNNFNVIKIFSFDESAYTDQRSEFDQIFNFIIKQSDKVALCCDKVDRLSRNIFDKRISALYDKALNDEIELHFTSDGQVITSKISAVEKFQFGISLGLAKYYSDAISDNVKRAQEQMIRKGEWIAKAPFGYKHIKQADGIKNIIIDEFEAAIVKKCFELYATGAYSLDLLKQKINKEHRFNWSKGYLNYLLNQPFYYGMMLYKNKEYPHKYGTIISITLYQKVQSMKQTFRKEPVKYGGKPYIYRGLIRCADCGLSVTPEKHKNQYIYYHCTQYNGHHNAPWIREEEITKQLGAVFNNLNIPKKLAQLIVETMQELHIDKINFHTQQHDSIKKESKEVTQMLDNLYLDKLKGRITDSDYDKYYIRLREQQTELALQLSQLQDTQDNYHITAQYVITLANKAYELFKSSEIEEKRQLIKLLLSNLQLKDKKLIYKAQKPFDLILDHADRQNWCARQDSNLQPTESKPGTLSN